MSGFEYSALDPAGRETRGVIEADTERHARSLLRERGLAPLAVEGIDSAAAQPGMRERFSRPGLSRGGLALLTRQFATLVRAGLTIEECLNVLIEQSDSARARRLLAAVRARVLEGQSLSHSLAEYPDSFPQIYRAMVEAGEHSGRLGDVHERLADYTESRESLRDKVIIAFIYPALVTVVALAVVGLLLVYVVPQVTRVFVNLGQALPLATRILIAIGVPLLASLQSAAAVLTNLPMRAAVDEAVRRVREGGALAPSLGAAKLFPPLVIHLIASGEATGRLDTMLEPLLILAMGMVVLFVVVAILLPIFEMNQLVR